MLHWGHDVLSPRFCSSNASNVTYISCSCCSLDHCKAKTQREARLCLARSFCSALSIISKSTVTDMDVLSPRLCSSKTSDDSKLQKLDCSMLGVQNQVNYPWCLVASTLLYVYRLSKKSQCGLDVRFLCLCRSKTSKGPKMFLFPSLKISKETRELRYSAYFWFALLFSIISPKSNGYQVMCCSSVPAAQIP